MTTQDIQESRKSDEKRGTRNGFWQGFLSSALELALIFGVFAAYGAWPVPDVNEQYYVGKSIHFWNRAWLANDPFLNTPDSHWLFYATFGLLSLVFKQNALVWVGRCVVWFLTALAWRRLSRALIPKRWFAVLTAAAFAFYLESFHLAGEWIFGGVEGKGFAFPFVFWGLACFLEGKYNRAWILYGVGSAFHVLVGGWAVLASLVAWSFDAWNGQGAKNFVGRFFAGLRAFARALTKTAPGLILGGAISLLGVLPALALDSGATPEIIRESRQIYVFERLAHHLVASSLPWTFQLRFLLLVVATCLGFGIARSLARLDDAISSDASDASDETRSKTRFFSTQYGRLVAFVGAAFAFACVGATIDWGAKKLAALEIISDSKEAAGLLRYYWYRLSDWAVPLGLVFFATDAFLNLVRRFQTNDATRDEAKSSLAPFLVWLFGALGVYWIFRSVFYRVAVACAQADAVDGLIPLPKPTEDVSFLASIDALGVLLLILLVCVAFSRRSRSCRKRALDAGLGVWLAIIVAVAPCWRLASFVDLRGTKVVPRSAPPKESIADGWLDVCRWVRENTPEKAIFLAPRGCDSFKWEARRAEAGSWKEIPQDAKSIVRWNRKMEVFYANPGAKPDSPMRWNQPLIVVFINKGRARILEESKRYGYQYAIVETPPYTISAIPEATRRWNEFEKNDVVYENDQFVVLKLDKSEDSK